MGYFPIGGSNGPGGPIESLSWNKVLNKPPELETVGADIARLTESLADKVQSVNGVKPDENGDVVVIGGGAANIDDDVSAADKVWSSQKTQGTVNALAVELADKSNKVDPYVSQGKRQQKPILVFVDDDGRIETWTKTRALFNRKGKKFVSAVSTSLVGSGNYVSLEQIRQMISEGHEISSHTVTHNKIVDNKYVPEVKQSKDWFNANNIPCDTITWVGGGYNDNAIAEAKKYYKAGLSIIRGKNTPPVAQFTMRRYAVGSMFAYNTVEGILEDGSQTQYNAMVDLAKNNNALVIGMMHNWDPAYDATQEARVEAMIDYADAQGVEIMTISEALEYFGNMLDLGSETDYFRIGANGVIANDNLLNKMRYKYIGLNPVGINNDAPYSAYEKGFVTVAVFATASGSGFPGSHGGTLVTYYLNDQYTVQQEWYPYGKNMVWFRQYNTSTVNWYAWTSLVRESAETVSVNIASKTVNPNSIVEVTFNHPDPTNISGSSDVVLMSPVGGLENNLIFNVSIWSNKTIVLRLYNPTASAITTVARNWRVKVLK